MSYGWAAEGFWWNVYVYEKSWGKKSGCYSSDRGKMTYDWWAQKADYGSRNACESWRSV